MSKKQDMQRIIRAYKDETGEREVDMHQVAIYAHRKGWPLPIPRSPIDMLTKEFQSAAHDAIDYDKETGHPYRLYHAVPVKNGDVSLFVYVDINEAPRHSMLKSLVNRREQMVSDGVQLTFDMEHWNNMNPKADPIALPMDLTLDIEWRMNTPEEEEAA